MFILEAIKEAVKNFSEAWAYYNRCYPRPKPRKQQQQTHEVLHPSKDKSVSKGATAIVNKGLDMAAASVLRQIKWTIILFPIIFLISEITTSIW
jgi:hypothetical protein